ncbi:NAD(P)H-dependent oxidoreductase [Pasteurellaceae bacterium RH1A]|nr:NAD(P)H-dependent oxidoreductase [Pasteurellaceae bacterium RH1A]
MSQITKEQMLAVFSQRCSTRYYDPSKKISDEDFNYILELGRLSPSSVGSEPWQFLVIQNQALRDKLKPFSWGMATQIDDCSHLVVILAKKNARFDTPFMLEVAKRKGLNEEQIQKALEKYENFQVNDLPIAHSQQALFDWACKQTYIALANMLTGAAAVGIDSCPIEGFNYAQMNEVLAQEGLFNPEEYGVSVAVTFGYRSKEIARKSRRPLSEMVTWVK